MGKNKFLLKRINNLTDAIEKSKKEKIGRYVEFLADYIDDLAEIDEFYELPSKYIFQIIKESDLESIDTVKKIIKNIVDTKGSKAPLVLNYINTDEGNIEDLFEIISMFENCYLLKRLNKLWKKHNIKKEPKEKPKKEQKDEPKDEQKEEPKDEPKDEQKEEPKDEPKDEQKEEPKEELKGEPKERKVITHKKNLKNYDRPDDLMISMHDAARNGKLDSVEFIMEELQGNPDMLDKDGQKTIHTAAANGHLEIVQFLIEKGANPKEKDENGEDLLLIASKFGHINIVEFLIESNLVEPSEYNSDGNTSLHLAASNGFTGVVEFFIKKKLISCEFTNKKKQTPLLVAAENGRLDVVKYLIGIGANKNVNDISGFNILTAAARKGHLIIVSYLINEKILDVNSKDKNQRSAMHIAASTGNLKILNFLIVKAKADLEVTNKFGRTPLHVAVEFNHENAIRIITRNGADIYKEDEDGKTPLDLASSSLKHIIEESSIVLS